MGNPLSLNDRLSALTETLAVDKCSTQRLLEKLDPETAKTLLKLLNNPGISTSGIHRELRTESYRIGRGALSEPRNGPCRCEVTV